MAKSEDHGAPPWCSTRKIRWFGKQLILKDFFATGNQWRRECPPRSERNVYFICIDSTHLLATYTYTYTIRARILRPDGCFIPVRGCPELG